LGGVRPPVLPLRIRGGDGGTEGEEEVNGRVGNEGGQGEDENMGEAVMVDGVE